MRTGPVEPGSTHDLTAAGLHVPPALYRSAWPAMPVLADKGYQGAGIGVPAPTKNPCPTPDEQTRNNLLSALRAPAEREGAMFKHFRALQRVSPRAPRPSPRSWPPPSSSSPSGTIPDTNPGEKSSVKANHDEARGLPDIAKVVGVVARDGPLARANSALFQMFVDGYASQKDGPVHRSTGSAGWRSDPSSESGCG